MSRFVKYADGKFILIGGPTWGRNDYEASPEEFQQLCDEVMAIKDNIRERLIPPFVVHVNTKYDDYDGGDQRTIAYGDAFIMANATWARAAITVIDALADQWLTKPWMVDVTVPTYPEEKIYVGHLGSEQKLSEICCGMLATWLERFSSYINDREKLLATLHPKRLRYIADCIEDDDELRSELEELAAEKETDPA